MDLRLSAEDRKKAQMIMIRYGFGNIYTDRDVEVLINWWIDFVRESTSEMMVDRQSYVEDLGIRSVLQVLLEGMRPRVAHAIADLIAESDEKYRQVGRRDQEFVLDPTLRAKYPQEFWFWLYGIPETVTLTD